MLHRNIVLIGDSNRNFLTIEECIKLFAGFLVDYLITL